MILTFDKAMQKQKILGAIIAMLLILIPLSIIPGSPLDIKLQVPEAHAHADGHSHFRFGHINWHPTANPNEVEFNILNAFRRCGYSGTAPDNCPAVGDTITETIGGTLLLFGDGTDTGILRYRVDAINTAEDWLFAHAIDPSQPDEKIRHTYSGTGPFTAEIDTCCRTFLELNNPSVGYRVSTIVDLSIPNQSPVSTIAPIVTCPVGLCTFVIPAADGNGDLLNFRLSTSSEASSFGTFTQPGAGTAQPLSVTSTGTVTWDTTGFSLGLYSTSITIEEIRSGSVVGKVMVDFLVNIGQPMGTAPRFDIPPTPSSGSAFNIDTGDTLTFNVQCSDPDEGDTVVISDLGLPVGATLTPEAPLGNPATGTFSWTPTSAETVAITFTCQDSQGNSALPHSVSIVVKLTIPVALTQTDGVLTAAVDIGDIVAGQAVELALTNNVLPNAQLNSVEFTPALGGTNIGLGITVSNQVIGVTPPENVDVTLYFEFVPSGSLDLSLEDSFTALPTVIFQVEKVDRACPTTSLFFFDVSLDPDQWVELESPTVLSETNGSCIEQGNLPHISKFSVGGVVRPTSRGGGGSDPVARGVFPFGVPGSSNFDSTPPSIVEVLTESGSPKVFAKILDNVAVKDANLIVGKTAYPMKRQDGNAVWWTGVMASAEVDYKIVARDYVNNVSEHSGSIGASLGALSGGSSGSGTLLSQEDGSFAISMQSTIADQHTGQAYSITADGVKPGAPNVNPQITINNTGAEPMKNIRVVLSPELKGKFLLSDYAIKSIPPQSEATVSLKLNGRPNVDVMNNPIPYNGKIVISIDNHTPMVLELSGGVPNESALLQSIFMKTIASKAEQRYEGLKKPDLRISERAEYEVALGSGESVIRNASDELIITNTGEKPLKNLRIATSALADHFLLDQDNIASLPAGSFVKVKLMSKLNNAELARDLQGELLIVPENGASVTVPINIGKKLLQDKNTMYEVRTVSGSDSITSTADGIRIRNNSDETIDNVRLIIPRELARVFSLSEYSFKSIGPNDEKTVYLRMRGTPDSNVKQMMNDYTGEIIIVSSDGMKKVVPVNIVWKGISSVHFVVYASDNAEELEKATQVINFLERSYSEATEAIGETKTRSIIYMTSSFDELKILSDALLPSTYVYNEDVGFVWSNSEDVNILALREFVHRAIMHSYGTYWAKQKISMDRGNWLVDGASNYVTAKVVGERGMIKDQLDSFIAEPTSFEWYGTATPSQYGATYTLFKFLEEKYGYRIIDKTLSYLGSTMISNHRCGTIEQCVLVRAVYDANGFSLNDKKHDLSFATIMQEWNQYVQENYGINEDELRLDNLS